MSVSAVQNLFSLSTVVACGVCFASCIFFNVDFKKGSLAVVAILYSLMYFFLTIGFEGGRFSF